MIGGILLIILALFGISIIFGKAKLEQFYKFVLFLIFAPLLLAVGVNHVLWLWSGLPFWMQALGILLLPFLLLSVLHAIFPKSSLVHLITDWLWDVLMFFLTFPIRLLYRGGRLIVQRERRPQRLAPHQTVVGRQPPLAQPRRNLGQPDHEE